MTEKWADISTEIFRIYKYPGGATITIKSPLSLYVKPKVSGDSHRIVSETADGGKRGHYIAPGWLAIEWAVKADKPIFVTELAK